MGARAGAFSAAGLWAGAVKAISHMFLQEYVFAPLLHIATSDEELGTWRLSFPSTHTGLPLYRCVIVVARSHLSHDVSADEAFEPYDPIAPVKQGYTSPSRVVKTPVSSFWLSSLVL
jgi:hypothetical protein